MAKALGIGLGLVNTATSIYNAIRGKKAAEEQVEHQKELQQSAKENQLDIWNKTNYEAQKKHMENAGLNPALMYGMSGGGGATTGSIGGQAAQENVYDIGQGVNRAIAAAQIEVAKSQAEKNRAEAEKIKGVDTEESKARTINLTQDVQNKQAQQILTTAQTRLTNLQSKIQSIQGKLDENALQDRLNEIQWTAQKAMHENNIASNEDYILEKTKGERIQQIATETINMQIEIALKQAGINATNAQINKMANEVMQGWENVSQGWSKIDNETEKIAIDKFESTIKANYPSITQSAGRLVEDSIGSLFKIFGKDRPTLRGKK